MTSYPAKPITWADFIRGAYTFAANKHAGHRRKYTNEDYIEHPIAVAKLLDVAVVGAQPPPHAVAAAYLHDVVEDCDVQFSEIEQLFGEDVCELVFWLTDVSRAKHGNRALRKKLDRWHICQAPFWAQTIKCADLIDNSRSIVEHDRNFAKVYLREKEATLRGLHNCSPTLRDMAWSILDEHKAIWKV